MLTSSYYFQTNYPIPKEEVEVYRALGEHENIVTHYGATFRGSEGHANIFMEKCGKLLKKICSSVGLIHVLICCAI